MSISGCPENYTLISRGHKSFRISRSMLIKYIEILEHTKSTASLPTRNLTCALPNHSSEFSFRNWNEPVIPFHILLRSPAVYINLKPTEKMSQRKMQTRVRQTKHSPKSLATEGRLLSTLHELGIGMARCFTYLIPIQALEPREKDSIRFSLSLYVSGSQSQRSGSKVKGSGNALAEVL